MNDTQISAPVPAGMTAEQFALELSRGFTARLVRRKSRRLLRRPAFRGPTREDVEQEFLLHVLTRLDRFRPEAGPWRAFVTTLVERFAATLVERGEAVKRRAGGRVTSLDGPAPVDDAPATLGGAVAADRRAAHRAYFGRDPLSEAELRLDVAEALSGLPPALRGLCEQVRDASVAEVARRRGLARTTLRRKLRRLRPRFPGIGRFAADGAATSRRDPVVE